MTQKEIILRHLQIYGNITPGQALEEYGVFRLAARIKELRDAGALIRSDRVKRKNRFGKTVTFTRYIFED